MRGALGVLATLWGLPQNLVGWAMSKALGGSHESYFLARVTRWGLASGLSMGRYVFVPEDAPRPLLVHEVGHSLQSLMLGPLYLPLVVVPSLIWAGLPALRRLRRRRAVSYYAPVFESTANRLGSWLTGERAPDW